MSNSDSKEKPAGKKKHRKGKGYHCGAYMDKDELNRLTLSIQVTQAEDKGK